jgi:hypothetical protein
MMTAKPKQTWPIENVTLWPIAKLTAYPQNVVAHPEDQVDDLVALITEVGWTTAILVDAKGEIVAGHGRLLAAQKMKLPKVPVIVAKGWSDTQIRAYRLADNMIPRRAPWKSEMVKIELDALEEMDFDTSKFGLDQIELPELEPAAPAPRANRTKSTIFLSVKNADVAKAKKACAAALNKIKVEHNL